MNPNFPPNGFPPQGFQQQPQYGQPQGIPQGFPQPMMPQQQQPAYPQQQQQQATFSPTDPAFLSMQLEYDAEADANASLPPVVPSEITFKGDPNLGYTVKAIFGKGWTGKMSKENKPYATAELMLEIVNCQADPAMNGRKVPFSVSTLIYANSGTSSAQQIIQAAGLGNELLSRTKTVGTLVELVNQIVNGGRFFMTHVDWEASFWDSDTMNITTGKPGADLAPRVRGWRNFPLGPDGKPLPELPKTVVIPQTGQQVQMVKRARMVARPITPTNSPNAQAPSQPAFNFAQPQPVAQQAYQPMTQPQQQPVQPSLWPQTQPVQQQAYQPQPVQQQQPQFSPSPVAAPPPAQAPADVIASIFAQAK